MIEAEVLDFVRYAVRSIWHVELLLHLRSHEGGWEPSQLVRELRASSSIVTDGLRTLEAAGLVAAEDGGRWRYAPASHALEGLTAELETLYRERPMAVTNALFAKADRLRSFADAFKLRKD